MPPHYFVLTPLGGTSSSGRSTTAWQIRQRAVGSLTGPDTVDSRDRFKHRGHGVYQRSAMTRGAMVGDNRGGVELTKRAVRPFYGLGSVPSSATPAMPYFSLATYWIGTATQLPRVAGGARCGVRARKIRHGPHRAKGFREPCRQHEVRRFSADLEPDRNDDFASYFVRRRFAKLPAARPRPAA